MNFPRWIECCAHGWPNKNLFGVTLVHASRLTLRVPLLTNNQVLRGRPILNCIVREFDLDSALGGVISAVELFQIPAPENDHASLVGFRDKVQHILTQLPLGE